MGFLEDLKDVAALSDANLDILVKYFKENDFDSQREFSAFEVFCSEKNINILLAKKLLKIFLFISEFCINERSLVLGLDILNKDFPELTKNSEYSKIWSYVSTQILNLEEFIVRRKEKQLSNINDNIGEFNVVCDIRPLFDVEKKKIVRYLYPILFSIVPVNSEEKIVFELDEETLLRLKQEIDFAVSKLRILKESIK